MASYTGRMVAKPGSSLNLRTDARIGVFGHFGNQNLGDESIITAVIQNIRQRLPNAEIIGFSLKPDDTSARYNIPAYPIRHMSSTSHSQQRPCESQTEEVNDGQSLVSESTNRSSQSLLGQTKEFAKRLPLGKTVISTTRGLIWLGPALINEVKFLRKVHKRLKNIDLLMITGSNQFLDNFGGPWGFPYTLLKWSVIAKLTGTKLIYLCVGAGPISSRLSMAMVRRALALSNYTSLRDKRSQELLKTLGAKGSMSVYPDLAYSLSRNSRSECEPLQPQSGKTVVGINPMPIFDRRYWHIHDAEKYADYVKKLAEFSASLLQENCRLVFWGTQPKDQNVIHDVINYLTEVLHQTDDEIVHCTNANTVECLLQLIETFDITVVTRFHGVVLSLFSGKPVMSICYHQKMDDLMKEMGQSDYSVMFDTFNSEDMLERFLRLKNNMDSEVKIIRSNAVKYSSALDSQYKFLFGIPVQTKQDTCPMDQNTL